MTDLWGYTVAFGLGFFGGAHCIGMCGGIMAALSFGMVETQKWQRLSLLISYNLGRIGSYVTMGIVLGSLGFLVSGDYGLLVLRVIAAALLIAMGLYLADWWRGLIYVERAGSYLWRYIQPLGKHLLPVSTVPQALLLGLLWGWLPCGLVYSVLAYAATKTDALAAGLTMLAFGLGTLPALFAGGLLAERAKSFILQRNIRLLFALAIIGFGLWTLMPIFSHSNVHANHSTLNLNKSVEPTVDALAISNDNFLPVFEQ